MKTRPAGTGRLHSLTPVARTCTLLLILLLAAAVQSCGRSPAEEQLAPSSTVLVEPATATLPPPDATLEPTAAPSASPSPLASPAIVEIIDLGGPSTQGRNPLAVTLSAGRIYVANEGSRNVSIIEDGRVTQALPLGQGPYRLATDSASGRVYLTAEVDRALYVLAQEEIVDIWPMTLAPTAIAVSGGQVWVGGADGTILRLDARSGHTLSADAPLQDGMVVDLLSLEGGGVVAATFSQVHLYASNGAGVVASRPYPGYRAVAAGGNRVYVCAYDRKTGATFVEELDGANLALLRSVDIPDDAAAIAIDALRDHLFVSGSVSNSVELINLVDGAVLARVTAGLSPQRLAFDSATNRLFSTFFGSDTLVSFAAGDLSLVERVPLSLRVTALALAGNTGVYAGLNTGAIRSITSHSDSLVLSEVGYPVALASLPEGAGLAVLDRAASEVVLYDTAGAVALIADTTDEPRGLYIDTVAGDLYAGDTVLSVSTGTTRTLGTPADPAYARPVQVLHDTRRNRLYSVALNDTPGSNGGYVMYRQEGPRWETIGVLGRLSVVDIVYDEGTDRFFSINGHMGEYGIQVYDPESSRELHYLPLQAPPVAMLLNGPYHHLWVATFAPATGPTPAHTVLTAYDTRVFAPVAIVRINDAISVATVDPRTGRLYLASGDDDLIYVLQDVVLPAPKPAEAPTSDAPLDTPTPPATDVPTETPTPRITITAQPTLAPRTATPTPTVLPSCVIPVQADLLGAWTSDAGLFGCPTFPAMRENWGWQPFEGGAAFWRRDTRQVLVTLSSGVMLPFEDRWLEGMPDQPCQATPPEGLWQPIRGFGLVWCQESGVREGLGWAVQPESAFLSTYQLFGTGVMFKGPDQGVIWLDNQGTWRPVQP